MVYGVDPYLVERLGVPLESGLELRFKCFSKKCEDRRRLGHSDYKLYVNSSKGVFHCVACDIGGSIDYLYKSLGMVQHNSLKVPLSQCISPEENESEPSSITMPRTDDNWMYSSALDWLLNRLSSVPYEEVSALLKSGLIRRGTGRYWDRIFFVDMFEGRARYWTARQYQDNPGPKYLNPRGVPRRNVLFNQDRVCQEFVDEILICEGPISAIVAGPCAVATYGRCVTYDQIRLLDSLTCSRFVIVSEPDYAARKCATDLAHALKKARRDVSIVDMPVENINGKIVEHDPASLGRSRFAELVSKTVDFGWHSELCRRLSTI